MSTVVRMSNALSNALKRAARMPSAKRQSSRQDNEFLPAAIEILETPPSPRLRWPGPSSATSMSSPSRKARSSRPAA